MKNMQKFNIKFKIIKWGIIIILLIIGTIYTFFKTINFEKAYLANNISKKEIKLPFVEHDFDVQNQQYIIDFKSKIDQKVKMNIIVDDIIERIVLNDQVIDIEKVKKIYNHKKLNDWRYGYDFDLELIRGYNKLIIFGKNVTGGYSLNIVQKFTFIDFIILFLCFGLIFTYLSFEIFIYLMKIIFKIKNNYRIVKINWPILILFGGILIRFFYVFSHGYASYNHDHSSHIEFIKFISNNFIIPLPDKGFEYPQQPLYYIVNGILYRLLNLFINSEHIILIILTWISWIISCVFLVYVYRLIKLFTRKQFLQSIFIGILSFTPSLVFIAGRLNNDVLNMMLAGVFLFYATRYYMHKKIKDYILMLILASLAFLTKLSSAIWFVFLGILFIYEYIRYFKIKNLNKNIIKILNIKVLIFGAVGLFLLCSVLLRAYTPSNKKFLFVHGGIFGGQEIKKQDFKYFFSFNVIDLINEGHSYTYEQNTEKIRQSFITFQYGTLFFGEYDYKHIFKKNPIIKLLMQFIYIFGLLFIISLIGFVIFFRKNSTYLKFLIIPVFINLLLIVKFSLNFPSVCTTDFRFFSPSFAVIALLITFGVKHLLNLNIKKINKKKMKKIIIIPFVILFLLQIGWLILLFIYRVPNSVS